MDDVSADLERLYRDELPTFIRVATAITGDEEAARDAVQEAFAAALRRLGTFRREGPLAAWVWRIVVRSALDQRARAPRSAGSADASPQPELAVDTERAAILVAIARLPERQRLALFLRYYADLDYSAIADALGVSAGTVAASLHAAHSTLRVRLEAS